MNRCSIGFYGHVRIGNNIKRPAAHVIADTADVFADDANGNKLNTAQKQYAQNQGSPAWNRIVGNEAGIKRIKHYQKRYTGNRKTRHSCHFQREIGERSNAIERKTDHFTIRVTGFSFGPFGTVVFHKRLLKAAGKG